MEGPGVELLQLATLYHASQSTDNARKAFSIVDVADFDGMQQDVASLIVGLMHDDEVTPMAVMGRCIRVGKGLADFYATRVREEFYGTLTYCANEVRDHANRRRVLETVTRARQQLMESSIEVDRIVETVRDDLQVHEARSTSGLTTVTFDEVMATAEDTRPWLMPDMMRTNERLVITGPEGGGKSVLVAQMCLGAAMGVSTMDPLMPLHEPRRVLMLDVENDRLGIKSNLRKVYPYLREMTGGEVRPDIEWVDIAYIDLSDPVSRQRVIRLAKERQPDLMYMGSLYKLAPEVPQAVDSQFYAISRTVDQVRAETGASVIIEAHTGHGVGNDRNGNMRPSGSSMWMRWPEFGIAMLPQRGRPTKIGYWRGNRIRERTWPGGLQHGEVLPWIPISQDEYEARWPE